MTTKPSPEIVVAINEPTNDGWTTIQEESGLKVVFEDEGDTFIGVKMGTEVVEWEDPREGPQSFTQYLFRGPEDKVYAIQESYRLQKLADVPDGALTKVTLVKKVDVGQPSEMKDFRIQYRMI